VAEARERLAEAERLGYEPTDVDVKAILWIGLITVVVVGLFAAALVGLIGLFHSATQEPRISPLERVEITPPEPRLEANPALVLDEVRHHEQQLLEGYGWVDRGAGIARIPITQAMRILAARGWTSKAEPESTAAGALSAPEGSAQ
jgi:hypothetical protein